MLAYRHAFHVGIAADVLKHIVLLEVLQRMVAKDKGLSYIDTHAGSGVYVLSDRMTQRLAGYRSGIGVLWDRADAPPSAAAYVQAVRSFNPDGSLQVYPGSPALAAHMLREQDQMVLFELHPSDFRALNSALGSNRNVQVRPADGFTGLKGLLPPPSRRGVVLMDPSYELDADYAKVVSSLREGLERFATGVYVVWYPMLQSLPSVGLPKRLRALAPGAWLHAQLVTDAPRADGFGMMGSGMFVINPPFGLHDALRPVMPWLANLLGHDGAGRWSLEQHTV